MPAILVNGMDHDMGPCMINLLRPCLYDSLAFYHATALLPSRLLMNSSTTVWSRQLIHQGQRIALYHITELIAWEDAMQMALQGTIQDAKTLVGLLLWDRFRHDEP